MHPIILGGYQSDFAKTWFEDGFVPLLADLWQGGSKATGIDAVAVADLAESGRVAVYMGNFNGQQFQSQGHLGAFLTEVDPVFAGVPGARYEAACASGSIALGAAATAIRAGDIDLAVVAGAEIMKNVNPSVGNDYLGSAAYYDKEAKGERFIFPQIFGRLTEKLLAHDASPGKEILMQCFDTISATNYGNAKSNPNSQTRDSDVETKMDMLDRKFQKAFGGVTRYRDCSQITDGGAILFLASEDFAKNFNGPKAKIKGWGHTTAPVTFATRPELDPHSPTLIPWTTQSLAQAYSRAGVKAADINVFETHDCFTSTEYCALSAFGITEPGSEHKAILDGDIEKTGKTPVNPSGGLIGSGHPVGATGIRMMLDLYKQVTEQAGGYQIKGAELGAMLNIGGSFTSNLSFVVGATA